MLDLSLRVLSIAHSEGLSLEQVESMVASSALVKHARGNRRFHDWVFQVVPGKNGFKGVTQMSRFQSPEKVVSTPDYPVMFEVCPNCESDGCKECGWTGELQIVYQP